MYFLPNSGDILSALDRSLNTVKNHLSFQRFCLSLTKCKVARFCAASELFINPLTQQFALTAYYGSRTMLDAGDMTVTGEDMVLEFMSLKFQLETHR